jgi:DNA polymerase-4
MRLSEMVGRRLREHRVHARTLQLKLRYKDFRTITRARTLPAPSQLDNEIFDHIRELFLRNWQPGAEVRLLGVEASSFSSEPALQRELLGDSRREKWQQALGAADRLRDRFGETSVTLATGLKGGFRERTHENPADFDRKPKPKEP